MSSRMLLNPSTGQFEVEGSEEFVLRIYADAKEAGLFSRAGVVAAETLGPDDTDPAKPKTRRSPSKKSGQSCAERILELRQSGFFDTPRAANEIKVGLEQNGHAYAPNQVGAALTSLYKRGELRRLKPGKEWAYQKP